MKSSVFETTRSMKKYFYGYPAGNYMFKVNNKH